MLRAAMAEWLYCLARTIKVLCSNLGTTTDGMTLDKSLTAVCLESPWRGILITCDIHRPLWLVSVYEELKWLSGETLCQAGFLSTATSRNSCRKNIGLSKLSPDSTLCRKVDILSFTKWSIRQYFILFYFILNECRFLNWSHSRIRFNCSLGKPNFFQNIDFLSINYLVVDWNKRMSKYANIRKIISVGKRSNHVVDLLFIVDILRREMNVDCIYHIKRVLLTGW
jgi:hypothetical protein